MDGLSLAGRGNRLPDLSDLVNAGVEVNTVIVIRSVVTRAVVTRLVVIGLVVIGFGAWGLVGVSRGRTDHGGLKREIGWFIYCVLAYGEGLEKSLPARAIGANKNLNNISTWFSSKLKN